MSMDSHIVLVTGAGVDKTPGIDFPLACDLLPAINGYLTQTEEGKKVDAILRDSIPGLRFRFDRFINNAITEIAHREPSQLRDTIAGVQKAVDELPDDEAHTITRKQGALIVKLFNQLQSIAQANEIDDDTRQLIQEVFQDKAPEFDLDDHVVDIRTLSISDTFKAILRYTLRESLASGANAVARALGGDLLDIERLLIEKFLGFYNNKMSDIKSYVYIAWCFWACMVSRNKQVHSEQRTLPFYSGLPKDWHAVTLNYTDFLERQLGAAQVCYFHGGLTQYVRMDNRQLLRFDGFDRYSEADLLERGISKNLRFDNDYPSKSLCLIPALVPPLRLKPVLSKEYIDIWHRAGELLRDAKAIVLVGCSLNAADEHFNDLLRANSDKPFYIVGPDVHTSSYMERVTSILGRDPGQFTGTHVQDRETKVSHSLHLIQACAHELDMGRLLENQNAAT